MLKPLKRNSNKFIKLRIVLKNFIKHQLLSYIVVFSSLILCAFIFDKWIEATMFCVAHTCIRNAFDKQFHFNKTAYCLILTLAIVWFAIPITLPITTSLLSSIPVAFLVCYFGFVVQDWVDLKLYKRKHEMFNLKTCTKEQLIEACNILGYNNEKQELAIMFFIDKLSNRSVWEKLCELNRNVDIDTIKTYKYRMKKELNSLVKTKE